MESELVRQAEVVFGESITKRIEDPPRVTGSRATDGGENTARAELAEPSGANLTAEPPADVPPVQRLHMTSRQERRLWHHVGSIENFWQSLTEIEPGMIKQLAAMAAERRWEIIFLTKRPATAG